MNETTRDGVEGSGVGAVLFDYGQVLSQGPNAAAWERLRAVTGGDADLFHAAYWKFRHPYDRGDLSGTDYWHAVADMVGHAGLTESELESLYLADVDLWGDLNEPMVLWAGRLQDKGVRTGILSNIGDRMETGIRGRFDWIGRFDHCVWSHALKLAKPEQAIYLRAAEGLGVAPADVLFVDDRADNIAAAREAGMQAVRYESHEQFEQEMRERGLGALL